MAEAAAAAAAVNESTSVPYLVQVLHTVSTGVATVSGLSRDLGGDHTATGLQELHLPLQNETGTLSADASKEGEYKITWLTLRLFFIVCFIIGLIVLSWGSYTLHRKCFDDKRKRKYQKALLL